MGNIPASRGMRIDWLGKGLLAPYVDAFKQYLTARGYAATTIANCVRSVAHFAQWAHGRRLRVQRVDEAAVAEFLGKHLRCCRCTGPVQRDPRGLRAALGHLLVVLRAQRVIASPAVSSTPVDQELRRYDAHMDHVRGLAPKTRDMALRIARRLLSSRFGDGAIAIAAIKPVHVRRFFARQAKLHSNPASVGSVVAALRGYFRYRASLGDAVHGLIGAVAYPANWQLSSLPKTLTAEEVEQLVGSLGEPGPRCARRRHRALRPRSRASQRRGRPLSLDDIDWRRRHDHLAPHQGPPRRRPAAAGGHRQGHCRLPEAGAPQDPQPRGLRAPHRPRDEPVGPDLVRKTIRQAYARAGLPYTRSHLLRHTMANRLLAGGSSLKEVADVLRHRSLNTTLIYAKLDSRKLAEGGPAVAGERSMSARARHCKCSSSAIWSSVADWASPLRSPATPAQLRAPCPALSAIADR
jgi:integrase/recombinase XerC